MRVLVLADSHREIAALAHVLKRHASRVDLVIHLGDGVEDLAAAARSARVVLPPVEAVRGNGDPDPDLPARRVVELEGRKALLVHGHHEGVGDGLGRALGAAQAAGAVLLLFAHTHKPFFEEYGRILALNPGSISRPRGRDLPTFAILDVPREEGRWYDVRFFEVGRGLGGIKEIGAP